MITNERQFRITKSQLDKLRLAASAFDIGDATTRTGSRILAQAELAALQSQIDDLATQLKQYEALRSGTVTVLKAEGLLQVPKILIQARISQGLSQRDLAEKIGVKEQQIQRYESEEYASASLRRLAEIAEVLNLNISAATELTGGSPTKVITSSRTVRRPKLPHIRGECASYFRHLRKLAVKRDLEWLLGDVDDSMINEYRNDLTPSQALEELAAEAQTA